MRPNGRILEIGGGSGAMAAAVLEHHPQASLTVVDVDPAMVAVAAGRLTIFCDRADARQADATALPFDDASFDVVLSFIMLHHVGEWEDAVREATRVLTPGGVLVGYDLLDSLPMRALHRMEGAPHRFMTLTQLDRLLRELPLYEISTREDLAGLVTRFQARRISTSREPSDRNTQLRARGRGRGTGLRVVEFAC
ncbi:MAG: class I SAM-dependent methyltransferase [Acidimicrobiales bacterium]